MRTHVKRIFLLSLSTLAFVNLLGCNKSLSLNPYYSDGTERPLVSADFVPTPATIMAVRDVSLDEYVLYVTPRTSFSKEHRARQVAATEQEFAQRQVAEYDIVFDNGKVLNGVWQHKNPILQPGKRVRMRWRTNGFWSAKEGDVLYPID